ncbi:PIN-like domain-containing protein [Uliginosibacterium sp. 31-12]|uniref:PIN-like domain-containing protein n=1 Tax=Uliginosibacterium sp. 31-12 TaxID=3062781 RepID=UPI0026E42CDF|nr:PIN-like domain-containing protein [Uliginosibacterium sp. 31-12]MDO6385335.1 PIN-like domain-containing protein [Uliginosibacterium sp. 31-12]
MDKLNSLEELLDRCTPIRAVEALHQSIARAASSERSFENTAVGLDASVFLRLASHPKRDDIVDYLDARLVGPLILPGQAIQEFWNNQLAVVSTVADGLKKKFDALRVEVEKLDSKFVAYADKMDHLLNEFSDEYGFAYDPATLRSMSTVLQVLERKAFVPFVPRVRFHEIAITRKRTKTPPGFKDDGDGDFYTWADFLLGLLEAREKNYRFDHVIIVTQDRKIDWSRDGAAHPILRAEIYQLFGVNFELWTIDQLAKAVGGQTPALSTKSVDQKMEPTS